MIFRKALKHPLLSQKTYSIADILNYSQVDSVRVANLGLQIAALLFAPIQIIAGLIMLEIYIGISFTVGLGMMMMMILLTFILGRIYAKGND